MLLFRDEEHIIRWCATLTLGWTRIGAQRPVPGAAGLVTRRPGGPRYKFPLAGS